MSITAKVTWKVQQPVPYKLQEVLNELSDGGYLIHSVHGPVYYEDDITEQRMVVVAYKDHIVEGDEAEKLIEARK
jgi:hypothetical protein